MNEERALKSSSRALGFRATSSLRQDPLCRPVRLISLKQAGAAALDVVRVSLGSARVKRRQ